MEREKTQEGYKSPDVTQRKTGATHHISMEPFVVLPNGRIESVFSRFEAEVEIFPNQKRRTGKNKRKFRR